MARWRNLLKVAVLLLLLGAAIWGGFQLLRRAPPTGAVFPDGSRLVFLGSAVGTGTFTTARPLLRWAGRLLTGRSPGGAPWIRVGSGSTSTNTITCFFHHPDPFLFLEAEGLAEHDQVQGRAFDGAGVYSHGVESKHSTVGRLT